MTTSNCSIAIRKVLIIGATSGIGVGCIKKFDELNYSQILSARNKDKLDKIQIDSKIGQISKFTSDLNSLDKFKSQLQQIVEQNIDITDMVFIAGVHNVHSILECDIAKFTQTLNTNLVAAYVAISTIAPVMKSNQFGRIVVISSISGTNGEAYSVGYSAAKAGLNGLVKSAAQELAKYNVLINSICPAWLNNQSAFQQLNNDEWCSLNNIDKVNSIDIAKWSMPTQRFIDENEVCDLVTFLVDKNHSITGQNINICGGLSLVQ